MTPPPVGTRTSPRPAVLSARGLPDRARLRSLRLVASPGELRLVRGSRVVRRVSVGPGADVAEARHLGGPLLRDVAPGSLGAVDLVGPGGSVVARLALRDWVPEAEELTRPAEGLRRSGLVPLLEHAGLPLRPVPPSEFGAALRRRPPTWPRPARLPVAYTVLRSVAIALAVVAILLAFPGRAPGALVRAAVAALLASTGAALALWARGWARDRPPRDAVPTLRPRPDAPVPRRFLRSARLRLEPGTAVVVDALGRERRLDRVGPLGVVSAVVVRPGTPTAAVELRTADGTPRATLPERYWGAAGSERLARVCAEAGLGLDRSGAPADRPPAEEEAARLVFTPPDRMRVRSTTWPHGLPGQAAVWQTALLSALLAVCGFGPHPIDRAPQWGAAVTLVLALGPHLVRLLVRRCWLDAPAVPRGR